MYLSILVDLCAGVLLLCWKKTTICVQGDDPTQQRSVWRAVTLMVLQKIFPSISEKNDPQNLSAKDASTLGESTTEHASWLNHALSNTILSEFLLRSVEHQLKALLRTALQKMEASGFVENPKADLSFVEGFQTRFHSFKRWSTPTEKTNSLNLHVEASTAGNIDVSWEGEVCFARELRLMAACRLTRVVVNSCALRINVEHMNSSEEQPSERLRVSLSFDRVPSLQFNFESRIGPEGTIFALSNWVVVAMILEFFAARFLRRRVKAPNEIVFYVPLPQPPTGSDDANGSLPPNDDL